jgi:hypothetical protein
MGVNVAGVDLKAKPPFGFPGGSGFDFGAPRLQD